MLIPYVLRCIESGGWHTLYVDPTTMDATQEALKEAIRTFNGKVAVLDGSKDEFAISQADNFHKAMGKVLPPLKKHKTDKTQ